MDYSMFSRPKLHDAQGIRYYPEYEFPVDQEYHRPRGHSHGVVLDREEEEAVQLQPPPPPPAARRKPRSQRGTSMRPRCTSEKKCPIYVHPIPPVPESVEFDHDIGHNAYRKVTSYLNDLHHIEQEPHISTRSQRLVASVRRSSDNKSKKAVLTKLEESYWANWKPAKDPSHDSYSDRSGLPRNVRSKAQDKKQKCKAKKPVCDGELATMVGQYDRPDSPRIITYMAARDGSNLPIIDEERSRGMGNECGDDPHMQVDVPFEVSPEFNHPPHDVCRPEETDEAKRTEVLFASPDKRHAVPEAKGRPGSDGSTAAVPADRSTSTEMLEDANRLRHIDSLIVTKNRKQTEERRGYQQPRCIRLYKKPGPSTTAGVVRGGTYPLKSCLKKESAFGGKRNIRLGRPGSPLIVTSNYYNNFPRSFRK